VDGLFAFNDSLAIGAMKAIHEAGLNVPNDIAIVGFDDIPVASYQTPSLSTVRQPVTKIARIAIQLLMDILEKKCALMDSKRTVLEPELVVRQSSIKNRNAGS
jgi:DNA-binding LacI/PurR family transcriptional regulator